MRLSVKSNVKDFKKGLNKFQKKEMPIATAAAINETLDLIKTKGVPLSFKKAFPNAKNKGFIKGVTMRKQLAEGRRGRFKKHRKLEGAVLASRERGKNPRPAKELQYLETRHVQGRPKLPRGRHIAVPNVKRGGVRRLARGYKPTPRQAAQQADTFVGKLRTSNEAIWKRKKDGLLLMYSLVPVAEGDKDLAVFYRVARAITRRHFGKALEKKFQKFWKDSKFNPSRIR